MFAFAYKVLAAVILFTILSGCAGVTAKQQSAMEWLESEYRPGAR